MSDNVTTFPGNVGEGTRAGIGDRSFDPRAAMKGFPKLITGLPTSKPRVVEGAKLRESVNRIGQWLELIDTMREGITEEQEKLVCAQLEMIEAMMFAVAYGDDEDDPNGGMKALA